LSGPSAGVSKKMTFLKRILSVLGCYCGLWRFLFWLCGKIAGGPIIIALTFHRVRPDDRSTEDFLKPYEGGITRSRHEAQIAVLTRYFDAISYEEFSRVVTGQAQPSRGRPKMLLTYDDGDSEHLSQAFEILSERGLPAVSFVPSGFVETSRHFWHVALTNICNHFTNGHWQQVLNDSPDPVVMKVLAKFQDDFTAHRHELRTQLGLALMEVEPGQRGAWIENWDNMIDRHYDLPIEQMTWADLKSLQERNIAVGSHTVNHVRLGDIPPAEQARELTDSRRNLTTQLEYSIDSVCYPEGSYNEETVSEARQAGYTLGFSSDSGIVTYPCQGDALFRIPREVPGDVRRDKIIYPLGVAVLRCLLARLAGSANGRTTPPSSRTAGEQ
jgi:peptidoglycan/xylan/chitin deacetylase (PgdA/CDA1 family)